MRKVIRLEYWIERPSRAFVLLGLFTFAAVLTWLIASLLSWSTRDQFIQQAQLGLDALGLLVTAFALVAASHEIWKAATPPRIETLARYEAEEVVTTAGREHGTRATVPSGSLNLVLNNHGPGEAVLHDLSLRWWIDLTRADETIVISLNEPLLILRYVPELDLGGELRLDWQRADDTNAMKIDRSVMIDEQSSRTLPELRLECPDRARYFQFAGDEEAMLRVQVECRSLRREYLWTFAFPLPAVHTY